jgi:signal peptidase I
VNRNLNGMKIFTWLLSIIIGLVVLSLGLVYILPGYDIDIVRSDSMQPAFKAGDLIISVPPDSFLSSGIKIGSIIVFQKGDEQVSHRVVSVDADSLITKGDANEDSDSSPVSLSQVSGIYLFKVPALGYAVNFIKTKTGWFLCILLPSFLLLILIIREILKEAFKKDYSDTARVRDEIDLKSRPRKDFL